MYAIMQLSGYCFSPIEWATHSVSYTEIHKSTKKRGRVHIWDG